MNTRGSAAGRGARTGTRSHVRIVAATALAAAALLLTGCGVLGSGGNAAPSGVSDGPIVGTSTPSTPVPAELDATESLVSAALKDYNDALSVADWDRACGRMAPEAQARLIQGVLTGTPGSLITTCRDALIAVFVPPHVPAAASEVASSTTVEDVTVTGPAATITWRANRNGLPVRTTNTMLFENGLWLVVGTAPGP